MGGVRKLFARNEAGRARCGRYMSPVADGTAAVGPSRVRPKIILRRGGPRKGAEPLAVGLKEGTGVGNVLGDRRDACCTAIVLLVV